MGPPYVTRATSGDDSRGCSRRVRPGPAPAARLRLEQEAEDPAPAAPRGRAQRPIRPDPVRSGQRRAKIAPPPPQSRYRRTCGGSRPEPPIGPAARFNSIQRAQGRERENATHLFIFGASSFCKQYDKCEW